MRDAKYFPYGVVAPYTIPDVADKVLEEYFWIAKEGKIQTCLAYGLCLGFYRDKGYIVDDNDLDVIAVVNEEERANLKILLVQNGFTVGFSHPKPMDNTHFVKDKILLDVFWRTKTGQPYYQKFEYLTYKGREYPVPCPIRDYLKACYTNWEVKADEQSRFDV